MNDDDHVYIPIEVTAALKATFGKVNIKRKAPLVPAAVHTYYQLKMTRMSFFYLCLNAVVFWSLASTHFPRRIHVLYFELYLSVKLNHDV